MLPLNNRRDFLRWASGSFLSLRVLSTRWAKPLLLAIGIPLQAGCESGNQGSKETPEPEFSLGALSKFPQGDTFDSMQRLLVRRKGEEILVMSMVCTHQTCLLRPLPEGFECPCHGSRFDTQGTLLQGPAKRNLFRYVTRVSGEGELMVRRVGAE